MDINSIGFNGINKVGLNKAPKNKVVNFSGSDIISFSEATKVRRQTIKDLEEVGYTSEEANGLINKYSKTDAFKELTEGLGEGEEWMSGHNIEQIYDEYFELPEDIEKAKDKYDAFEEDLKDLKYNFVGDKFYSIYNK